MVDCSKSQTLPGSSTACTSESFEWSPPSTDPHQIRTMLETGSDIQLCGILCNSSNCRVGLFLVAALTLGGALAACLPAPGSQFLQSPEPKIQYLGKTGDAGNICTTMDGDVVCGICEIFRRDMDGDVVCQPRKISKYKFDWGNSDCKRILPIVIVRPRSDEDVARTVRRSVALGIPLSYRSGGHSYTCDGIKAGSAHIDFRSRKEKVLYRQGEEWYAQFDTGNTFKDLFKIIDRQRFSIVHGACHSVGVGGFYLHGGVHLNSLTAKYGWGNQTVVNMTVVTASGDILVLNAKSSHQDLWRAMLRSGSDFGIATSLTVRVFESPEPLVWLPWKQLNHTDLIRLFQIGFKDPRVQLNPYYVNPPAFQVSFNRSKTFTLQFSLLNGPTNYKQNLKQTVEWFRSNGFPLSRWTRFFNRVVPKPDDLSSMGYPKAWVSSHAIWPYASKCTNQAMTMLLEEQSRMIRRHRFHSFRRIECWLTFSRLPGEQIYYEYNCPSTSYYTEHLEKVEALFANICTDFVKYRNTPHRNASTHRYFPDHLDLLKTKRKWDPRFVLGPATMSLRDFSKAGEIKAVV